jgi:hypothetical protein
MFEYHAINSEEMTSEMKSKIRENIHLYHSSLRAQILHDIPDASEKLSPFFCIKMEYWKLHLIEDKQFKV